jgi:type I restriction enzyme S subunit
MKDSGVEWIGEIPDGWDICRIKDYFLVKNGSTPNSSKSNYWNGDIPWITPSDYKTNDVYINVSARTITKEGYDSCGTNMVPANSIIVSNRAPIGSVGIAKIPLCTSQGCKSLVKKSDIESKFVYYFLAISDSELNILGRGTTFLELSSYDLGLFAISIPPINEQKKIVDFLDEKVEEIESVIEKTKETIDDYKKYKQAIISDAVTKGLNPNVRVKKSKNEYLGMIPIHWNEKRIRFLGTCQNGISKSSEYFGEGYPFISYGDVYKNYALLNKGNGLVKSSKSDREIYSVQYGDVFFTRTSETIEEVGFASTCLKTIEDAVFAGFVIRFRPNSQQELLPEFSKYYFRSDIHRRFFVKEMNLVTRASLSQELLKKLPVLLPLLEEQKEIAEYLDKKCSEIDNLIMKKEELLVDLESYKKSLIYEYVTGKKEIR